jgi:hypothetical protein
MSYRFMQKHRNEYTVREMTAIFGVSGSAHYRNGIATGTEALAREKGCYKHTANGYKP